MRQIHDVTRRTMLKGTLAAGAGLIAHRALADSSSPNERVRVGVMGVSRYANGSEGRGSHLAVTFAALPNVEVAYVCDVDERYVKKAIENVSKKQSKPPQGVGDFRKILDDKSIDGLVVATPDHWHAPAAILGCAAGKHVYVEKPCCHNPHEGQLLVEAAAKYDRHVQHGTQRRTWPGIQEGMQKLKEGAIGRVLLAKCWYFNNRPTIGHGKAADAPSYINWDLWQGPAPRRPFQDNLLPYNWHWFWHWGTGELGNNGVHTLDMARWGLGVDCPSRVTSAGGKYRYDDDQQTPDTNNISLDFGDKSISWENRSWAAQSTNDPACDVAFYGETGSLLIHGNGYSIYDLKAKQVSTGTGEGGDANHMQNFVDAIRGKAKQNAPITEGYPSAMLCHYGNISYRTGHELHIDPKEKKILNDPEAEALWGREYQTGWEPKG